VDFSNSIAFPKGKTGGFLADKIAVNAATSGTLGDATGLLGSGAVQEFGNSADYAKALSMQSSLNTSASLQSTLDEIKQRSLLEFDDGSDMYEGWADKGFNEVADGVFTKPYSGASGLAGSRGTGIQGLQQGVSDRVTAMMAAARAAGFSVSVGGGWRSYEDQVRLKKAKPRLAATPGRSNHGWGLAADLVYGSAAARRWVHANAAKFGLRFPMGYEPWHIEPTKITKSGAGKAYAGAISAPIKNKPANSAPKKTTTAALPSRQILA